MLNKILVSSDVTPEREEKSPGGVRLGGTGPQYTEDGDETPPKEAIA